MSSTIIRLAATLTLAGAAISIWGSLSSSTAQDASGVHLLSEFRDNGRGRLDEALRVLGRETRAVIRVDIDDVLHGALKVPPNIALVHEGASLIDLAGQRLEIAGSFDATQAQIFLGVGKVSLAPGSTRQVLPQWWGSNDSDSVQAAMDVALECGAEVFMPAGSYSFDSTVEAYFEDRGFNARALKVRGEGPGRTVIENRVASGAAFYFGTRSPIAEQAWFLTVEGLEVTSRSGRGQCGIEVEDVWNGRISDCLVSDQAGDGIVMRADQNDFGLPKTWTIERSLIVRNGRYGIYMGATGAGSVAYNVTLDQLDIELNGQGGVYAAAELSRITNSIIANNGTGPTSQGGVHLTGDTGYRAYANAISGCGFEANVPYDIYADRVANLTLARNDHSRIQAAVGASQDAFVRLDGPEGAFNVLVAHNQFSSGIQTPFTAIMGGPGLESIELDNNRFNLAPGNEPTGFESTTKSTHRTLGDAVLTNQSLTFAAAQTSVGDVKLARGGPGILSVDGIATKMQSVTSSNGALALDCSLGLTVLHSLTENTIVQVPANPVAGAILNLSIFQPPGAAHSIGFKPIFKLADPLTASGGHFSTTRFLFTGLYWVQLGAAAIDAPL